MPGPPQISLPPHKHHAPAEPITPAQALDDVAAYLAAAPAAPHLHPDAIFTEHGPTYSQHAAEGGLILQLLRRVEQGLRGERITARLPALDDAALLDPQHAGVVAKSYNEQMLEQGEDGDVQGEVGERLAPVVDETVQAAAHGRKRKLDVLEPPELAGLSKEERKRYKKQLHKREQQEKNAAREAAAHAFQRGAGAEDPDVDMEDAGEAPVAETNGVGAKQAKKDKRKRDKEAKQQAQAQVEGAVPPSLDDDGDADAVLRPEERGRVEVVDRLGRDAADTVNGSAKDRKKTKAKANGTSSSADGTKKKKRAEKPKAGL